MGELISTIIGLLVVVGSFSLFRSLIADKHYQQPMKQNSIDDDAVDVILMNEVFDEAQD